MSRLVAIESMFSTTGSNADERIAIRPGDQVVVALSIAAQLAIKLGVNAPGGSGALEKYLPAKVASSLAASPATGEQDARVSRKNCKETPEVRGSSLVIGGSLLRPLEAMLLLPSQ